MCLEVTATARGVRTVSPEEERKGCFGKDLRKGEVLRLEWKSDGVVDDERGESIGEEVPVIGRGELELQRLV